MSQDNILRCLGLISQYNPLSIQAGALSKADNAVIDRENIVENRRGFSSYADFANSVSQFLAYRSRVVVQYSNKLAYDNGLGTFSDFAGTYSPPSGFKMRYTLARNNLYVTTDSGVKVFSDITGTVARLAGAPRSLDPSYILTGSSGFILNNQQVAYRCVIQRTDANNNTITGYPSQRLWVPNSSGGSRNVILTLYVPTSVIVGDVVQFYRTDTDTTGATSDTAGDNLSLAYQATLSAADITTGYITFTDSIVDTLLGAPLYTNDTEQGIAQANAIPPLARDIAFYRSSFLFFANTETKQRLFFTLVGVGSLSSKTITLAGSTYNFGSTEILSGVGAPQAKIFSSGVAATDIDDTARSLVRVINRNASNTSVYAYYLSGSEDLPGQILIEERGVGAAAYSIQASDIAISGMFFPPPPVSPVTNMQSMSSNESFGNRLYFSKPDEPEHTPLLNYVQVGPSNSKILRIAALRDSLIVIKEEGVYRLTGEQQSSFDVVPLDLTVFCKAADSVVVLQNTVMMLSNQGVVSISDTGVQVISREIEDTLKPILAYQGISTKTCAIGYESERAYLLALMTNADDDSPTQIFRYNIFTKTWTRWTFGFTAGVVEPDSDRMYFAQSSANKVYRERKDFSGTDYADAETAISIISVLGDHVSFTITGVTPLAGWQIEQGSASIAIHSVDLSAGVFTAKLIYEAPDTWVPGPAYIYPNVGFDIEWNVWSGAQPGIMKQLQQLELLTDNLAGNNDTTSLVATFKTDLDQNVEEIDIDSSSYKWGSSPWGAFAWGGISDTYAYPTWPPMNKSYGRLFFLGVKLERANEHVSIAGLSLTFDMVSERISK